MQMEERVLGDKAFLIVSGISKSKEKKKRKKERKKITSCT
jgi:hypothetical protein